MNVPERGSFLIRESGTDECRIRSHLKKICAILAWSLNIEFYILPITFLATPPRVSPVSTQLH